MRSNGNVSKGREGKVGVLYFFTVLYLLLHFLFIFFNAVLSQSGLICVSSAGSGFTRPGWMKGFIVCHLICHLLFFPHKLTDTCRGSGGISKKRFNLILLRAVFNKPLSFKIGVFTYCFLFIPFADSFYLHFDWFSLFLFRELH